MRRRSRCSRAVAQPALADDDANIPNPLDVLAQLAAGAAKSVIAAFSTPETDASLLDRQIGQMIMVGFAGTSEKDAGVIAVRKQLADGVIGGVVLYPENISSAKQLKSLTAYLGNAKSDPVPFIAVDQEGGLVSRLTRRNGYSNFPSARNVGRNPSYSTPESVVRLYAGMAHELADAGFNLNFGPVVDLSLNDSNRVIVQRKRSYGADPVACRQSRARFHRGASRGEYRHRRQTFSRTWFKQRRQPFAARRCVEDLARG